MAVKSVEYAREFRSKTSKKNISFHGSPSYENYQDLSDKDSKIREEAKAKFGIADGKFWKGFDGKIFYMFKFSGYPDTVEDIIKNVKYITNVRIIKAGYEGDISCPLYDKSDLEKFLIKHKFILKD